MEAVNSFRACAAQGDVPSEQAHPGLIGQASVFDPADVDLGFVVFDRRDFACAQRSGALSPGRWAKARHQRVFVKVNEEERGLF